MLRALCWDIWMPRRFSNLARRWRRCGRDLRYWMSLRSCGKQRAEFGIRSALSLLTGRTAGPGCIQKMTPGVGSSVLGRIGRGLASSGTPLQFNLERKYERSGHCDTRRMPSGPAQSSAGVAGAHQAGPEVSAALGAGSVHAGQISAWMRWLCSFPAMLGALLAGATFAVVRSFSVDPDMWWHIRTGELILATHRWATTDPYSYTAAGAPWMSCEWLGDVFFAVAYRLGGLRGLEVLLAVLAGAVMLALYGFATVRSGDCQAAFLVSGGLV